MRDTPVIAAAALITVFRDNYELARAHCAARHRSYRFSLTRVNVCLFRREERRGEERLQVRDRVCVETRGACARTTDVSKAADAVFVMLMPSLLTAQRASPFCIGARGGINSCPCFSLHT